MSLPTSAPGEEHILSDFEAELDPANRNLRFVNFLIDRVAFYLFMKGFYFLRLNYMPGFVYNTDYYTAYVINLLLGLLFYALFMGLMEGLFKGRTVGKLVTGTLVVNPNGTTISFKTGVLRGLARIIPFEPFSAFGGDWPRPWHDKLTDTYVVREKTSLLPGR
jgi:uncharacterized RDD family membrane protein YckC